VKSVLLTPRTNVQHGCGANGTRTRDVTCEMLFGLCSDTREHGGLREITSSYARLVGAPTAWPSTRPAAISLPGAVPDFAGKVVESAVKKHPFMSSCQDGRSTPPPGFLM
jgi:hypothetical protein